MSTFVSTYPTEKEAAYEALTDAEGALKHARAGLLDEATARVRAES